MAAREAPAPRRLTMLPLVRFDARPAHSSDGIAAHHHKTTIHVASGCGHDAAALLPLRRSWRTCGTCTSRPSSRSPTQPTVTTACISSREDPALWRLHWHFRSRSPFLQHLRLSLSLYTRRHPCCSPCPSEISFWSFCTSIRLPCLLMGSEHSTLSPPSLPSPSPHSCAGDHQLLACIITPQPCEKWSSPCTASRSPQAGPQL